MSKFLRSPIVAAVQNGRSPQAVAKETNCSRKTAKKLMRQATIVLSDLRGEARNRESAVALLEHCKLAPTAVSRMAWTEIVCGERRAV